MHPASACGLPGACGACEGWGTDEELLAWCHEHGRKPSDEEVMVWNGFMSKRGWNDDASARLQQRLPEYGLAGRKDIATFFDVIDADEGRM